MDEEIKGPDDLEWQRMSPLEQHYFVRGMAVGMEATAKVALGEKDAQVFMKTMKEKLGQQYPVSK